VGVRFPLPAPTFLRLCEMGPQVNRPGSLGELIHATGRRMIEAAVEELTAALGARMYERGGSVTVDGHRHGRRRLHRSPRTRCNC
jgi:hypothetical protein